MGFDDGTLRIPKGTKSSFPVNFALTAQTSKRVHGTFVLFDNNRDSKMCANNICEWHAKKDGLYLKIQGKQVLQFKCTKALHGVAYNPRKVLCVSTEIVTIDVSSLAKLVKDKNVDELANIGGVQGIDASLKSDKSNGIIGDPEDAFGSNTYRKPPSKNFFIFVWHYIFLLCAALEKHSITSD
ncbi:hypothetical protein R3W88_001505 [Solanum pinnatisectum]|uniref:Uncharacterized protein n=1 Tax=Solanum pinnatisectum TaxID=50273 RepID=A0AAV9MJ05_9SOLN|nr:hypothetical protein R3W88_001505 [Solanum pinnatisectum]